MGKKKQIFILSIGRNVDIELHLKSDARARCDLERRKSDSGRTQRLGCRALLHYSFTAHNMFIIRFTIAPEKRVKPATIIHLDNIRSNNASGAVVNESLTVEYFNDVKQTKYHFFPGYTGNSPIYCLYQWSTI